MSILQDTSKIQQVCMESGMAFDHDDTNLMLSTITNMYGARSTRKTDCGLAEAVHHREGGLSKETNQHTLMDPTNIPQWMPPRMSAVSPWPLWSAAIRGKGLQP